MSFWSGERLLKEGQTLFSDFDKDRIDCAAYALRLGDEAFVTSDKFFGANPGDQLIVKLEKDAPKNALKIPPGQFGFLITEEVVNVPKRAIAFISIKARYKFRGLINVSGFHVDPGFKGKLIFGVYNAGASDIVLLRGEKLFSIFFADLDDLGGSDTEYYYKGQANGRQSISSELIQGMTGQVFSPLMLQREMNALRDKLTKNESEAQTKMSGQESRIHVFEDRQKILWGVAKITAKAVGVIMPVLLIGIAYLSTSDMGRQTAGQFLIGLIRSAGSDVVSVKK